MASSSSNIMNPLIGINVLEKLSKASHAMWWAQVLTTIRGSHLMGHLTGATSAPVTEVVTMLMVKNARFPIQHLITGML
jgi:hypothetical protein